MPKPRLGLMTYDQATLVERQAERFEDLADAIHDDRVTWLDVQGLGDESVIRAIAERFGLHRLVLADILNLGQRPKVETYGEVVFCVSRMVGLTEGDVHWEQVSIVLVGNVVLSFQETYGDCLDGLRQRVRQGRQSIRGAGADYLAAMVLDAVVDGYFPVVESLGETLDRLEDDLVRAPTHAVLRRVYRIRRQLLALRRATWPMRDALAHALRDPPDAFHPTTLPYLRDIEDHVMQLVDLVETGRELAGNFVDIYLSSAAQRTSEVMRTLTVLAAIFIPLTFLAGVYGMNFRHMPELNWVWGYPLFWGICVVTAAMLLVVFRRKGWLGDPAKVADEG